MKKVILTLAALAVSSSAFAVSPRWTYGDIGYIRGDSFNEDTEGFAVRGSVGFADKWHARLEYSDIEFNGGAPGGSDGDGYNLVVGINPNITENTQFVFELSYFDTDSDFGANSEEETDGYGLGVGLRSMVTEKFELSGSVWSLSGDVDDNFGSDDFTDIVVTAGGQYYFTDNVGLGVDVNVGDGNSANWYVRYTF